jgi:hypothetical protein
MFKTNKKAPMGAGLTGAINSKMFAKGKKKKKGAATARQMSA